MAVNPISTAGQSGANIPNIANASAVITKVDTPDTAQSILSQDAAVYDKSDKAPTNTKRNYTRDAVTLSEISKQVEGKLASLRATVEELVARQSVKNGEAQGLNYDQIMEKYNGRLKEFYQNLEVDDATRLNAQQEISEDGFWGVKQTAARVIDFAKAVSGGDPSKINLLKQAIEEGYKAAEAAWGGELPEICKQTQTAIMQGLDDWAGGAGQPT